MRKAWYLAIVPAGGFVLTDVILRFPDADLLLEEFDGVVDDVYKLAWTPGPVNGPFNALHFESGIVFEGGTSIRADKTGAPSNMSIALSGYIPSPPAGSVPTVGQWGLVVMVLLLITAATVIFATTKTKRAEVTA